jgi:NAD-dependent deacetylase
MANKLIIVCGAGISASAGIPTYRSDTNGQSGLWKIHDMEKICTVGNEFTKESISFYDNFNSLLKSTNPSTVHYALADIQKTYGSERVKIFTQNIDDLLEKAGCMATHVHGTGWQSRCTRCNKVKNIKEDDDLAHKYCKDMTCGGRCRYNVVFYGERGNYSEMLESILDLKDDDVFILMGTSEKTIHVDMYLKYTKNTNIYINPVVEDSIDIEHYRHVILEKCEDCIEETKDLIGKYMR